MATAISNPAQTRAWRLLDGQAERGPFSDAYVLAGLRTATISHDTPARPEEGTTWRPLKEWSAFAAACREVPPPPVSAPHLLAAKRAWDPRLIAWFGLPFTPIWCGIMAAVNARRLGSGPVWRPVLIVALWMVADLLLNAGGLQPLAGASNLALSCLFDFAVVGLIWLLDLRPQQFVFSRYAKAPGGSVGWMVPVAAGAPLAALMLVAYASMLLLPAEPREVCRGLLEATTYEEAKDYATANLWPTLSAGYAGGDRGELDWDYELTADRPAESGGEWYVDCCFNNRSPKSAGPVDGVFHLVSAESQWKVEEVYFTKSAGEAFAHPVRYSMREATKAPLAGARSTSGGLGLNDGTGRRLGVMLRLTMLVVTGMIAAASALAPGRAKPANWSRLGRGTSLRASEKM